MTDPDVLFYDQIKGLPEAFQTDPQVVSNYCKNYVIKTFPAANNVTSGNVIFSLPNAAIKCAGAPQKIMYILDNMFKKVSTWTLVVVVSYCLITNSISLKQVLIK